MIEFLWPWIALLLPLPWLMRRWRPLEQKEAALRLPDSRILGPTLADHPNAQVDPWQTFWLCMAWVLLIGALARPQWLGEPFAIPRSARDLLLAVDLSASMGTADMIAGDRSYTRIDVVKKVLADFVSRRNGDRLGLIVFGSLPYLYVPLTFDHKTLGTLLEEAPTSIAGNKTAIGDAIGLAVRQLRDRPQTERVLVLLTDGANTAGEISPQKAAEIAAAEHVRIYTIGVGAEELRLPGFFGTDIGARFINPSSGLDQQTLTEIANTTGGKFFRARDPAELQAIYGMLDQIEPIRQDPLITRPTKSLFHWPLSLSLLTFAFLIVHVLRRHRTPSTTASQALSHG